jgi:hypothetical protein
MQGKSLLSRSKEIKIGQILVAGWKILCSISSEKQRDGFCVGLFVSESGKRE